MEENPLNKPVKTLPAGYTLAGSVTLTRTADLLPMLIWSLVLPALLLLLVVTVLCLTRQIADWNLFSLHSVGQIAAFFGGMLLVTLVMVIAHEGLHGLVFGVPLAIYPGLSSSFIMLQPAPAAGTCHGGCSCWPRWSPWSPSVWYAWR